MKKTIFLFLFLSYFAINSQSWEYKSGSNAFDGNYKTASIQGTSTDNSYDKPILVVNMYNEERVNFYISGAGNFPYKIGMKILWVFNNEPDTFYTTSDFSLSDDAEIIFLNEFKNLSTYDILSKLEFIEKLKTANMVSVRIINDHFKDDSVFSLKMITKSNDIEFSLRNSTKAIEYVIPKIYLKKNEEAEREAEIEADRIAKQKEEDERMAQEEADRIVKEQEDKKRQLDAMMGGLSNNNENSSSEGNTNISGYYGNNRDSEFASRKTIIKPAPTYKCQEEGLVIVTIEVDRTGKVVKATAGTKGSTNIAPCLLESSKEAALQTRFEPEPNAPEHQIGTIRYRFSFTN